MTQNDTKASQHAAEFSWYAMACRFHHRRPTACQSSPSHYQYIAQLAPSSEPDASISASKSIWKLSARLLSRLHVLEQRAPSWQPLLRGSLGKCERLWRCTWATTHDAFVAQSLKGHLQTLQRSSDSEHCPRVVATHRLKNFHDAPEGFEFTMQESGCTLFLYKCRQGKPASSALVDVLGVVLRQLPAVCTGPPR